MKYQLLGDHALVINYEPADREGHPDIVGRHYNYLRRHLFRGVKDIVLCSSRFFFRIVPEEYRPEYLSPFCVKVIRGLDADTFSETEYKKLFNQIFTVSKRYNRMGCFLNGLTPFHISANAVSEQYCKQRYFHNTRKNLYEITVNRFKVEENN